jgi:hypothetical protein
VLIDALFGAAAAIGPLPFHEEAPRHPPRRPPPTDTPTDR